MSTPSQTAPVGGINPFFCCRKAEQICLQGERKRAGSVCFFLRFPAFAEEICANPPPGSKHAQGTGREAAAPWGSAACFHQGPRAPRGVGGITGQR